MGSGLNGQHAQDPVCLKVVQQDGVLVQVLVFRPKTEVCPVTALRRVNSVQDPLARSISVLLISSGRLGRHGALALHHVVKGVLTG